MSTGSVIAENLVKCIDSFYGFKIVRYPPMNCGTDVKSADDVISSAKVSTYNYNKFKLLTLIPKQIHLTILP